MNLLSGVFLIFALILHDDVVSDSFYNSENLNNNEWHGRWFPQPPGKRIDDNPTVEYKTHDLYDKKHKIKMGISSLTCDNAQINLTIDWDFSPINYTCFEDRRFYTPRYDIKPIYKQDYIPPGYSAAHRCMNAPICYDDNIPTYGTHRPLWAKYGEYLFLPRQRWLHNLEHGAVAMLYHPCANKMEVNALKQIVKNCLYKHVITPYTLLPPEMPLALVTWGQKLVMSVVEPEIVIDFIRLHALQGPEKTLRDGQYELNLMSHAKVVSDLADTNLCPFFNGAA